MNIGQGIYDDCFAKGFAKGFLKGYLGYEEGSILELDDETITKVKPKIAESLRDEGFTEEQIKSAIDYALSAEYVVKVEKRCRSKREAEIAENLKKMGMTEEQIKTALGMR